MTKHAYRVTYPAEVTFTVVGADEMDALAEASRLVYLMEMYDVAFPGGSALITRTDDTEEPVVSVDEQFPYVSELDPLPW